MAYEEKDNTKRLINDIVSSRVSELTWTFTAAILRFSDFILHDEPPPRPLPPRPLPLLTQRSTESAQHANVLAKKKKKKEKKNTYT